MSLKGIIFDKDGTLFDYHSVWAPVFRVGIEDVLKSLGRSGDDQLRRALLQLLGIGDDEVYPEGLVFKSNSLRMLSDMWIFAKRWGISYRKLFSSFKRAYHGNREALKDSLPRAKPTGNLQLICSRLREEGYRIGLATSDHRESTDLCLDILGIREFFDFISTYDDHYRKKPHPESFQAFCRTFQLTSDQVAVVGDAVVDMRYGKRSRAGYTVALLTGSGDIKSLSRYAHAVYPDLDGLLTDPIIFPPRR